MERIRIKTGKNKGKTFPLGGDVLVLGRDKEADILIEDKGVSRRHAEIFKIDDIFFVRDLDSRNGTFVNEKQIDKDMLREGDVIMIGQTMLVFESSSAKDDEADSEDLEFIPDEQGPRSTVVFRLDDIKNQMLHGGETDHPEAAKLRAFYKLAKIISFEHSYAGLKHKILTFINELVPCDSIYIFIRDNETGKMKVEARLEKKSSGNPQVSKSIIMQVLNNGQGVLTSNAAHDARFRATESIQIRLVKSVISVPLVDRGEINGVLYLENSKQSRAFTEEDLELIAALGTQIGLTLQSIRSRKFEQDRLMSSMKVLVAANEQRSVFTQGHSQRVAMYCNAIALQMKLPEKVTIMIEKAALLHDIGKMLLVEGVNANEEYPILSEQAVKKMKGMEDVLPAIRNHCERINGSGFPDRLNGEKISLGARVVGVADYFDFLMYHGSHDGGPMTASEALTALGKTADKEFDADVVNALLTAYREGALAFDNTELFL